MAKQQMLPQLSAKRQFETELTQKEQQARRTFERQQRFPPSKRLVGTKAGAEYRRQRESEFETLLGEWKTTERAKFETRLQEWEPEASSPEMIRFYGLPSSREQAYPTKQQGGQGLLYVRQPIFRVYGRIARSREAKARQAEQTRSYQSWLRISRTRSYFMERGLEREAEEKGELAVTIPQVDPALVRRFSGKMMELEEKKQLFRVYEPAETVFEGIETPLSSVVRGVTAQTKHYPGEQYLVVPYSSEMAYAMLQGVMPQVKKTGEGYEFSVKPVEEPKGIAETLMDIHVPTLPHILGYYVPTPPELVGLGRMEPRDYTMTAPLAGFVGSFETPIYSVSRLMGAETPRPPPSLLSEYSFGHPAYGLGTFVGEMFQAYLMGKAITASPLGKPIAKIETKIARTLTEPLVGTRLDPYLYGKSGYWRMLHGTQAPQIVSFPTPEVTSLKSLEAQEAAWQLMLTPRTSGVTVAKEAGTRTVYQMFRGLSYTPMAITLAKATAMENDLLSAPQQIAIQVEKPQLKQLPYIPTLETSDFLTPTSRALVELATVSFALGITRQMQQEMHVSAKIVSPTVGASQLLRPQRLTSFATVTALSTSLLSVQRERMDVYEETMQSSILIQESAQKSVQIQKTSLAQIGIQVTAMEVPAKTMQFFSPPPMFREPEKAMRKKKRKKRKGETVAFGLVTLEWPVASVEEFLGVM